MNEQFEKLPENERPFGHIAIEKRFINPEQLGEALDIQITEETKNGKHKIDRIKNIRVSQDDIQASSEIKIKGRTKICLPNMHRLRSVPGGWRSCLYRFPPILYCRL